MINSELLGLLAGLLLTLFIYSYLLGDNWFYRIAVHILVGVSAAYAGVVAIEEVFIPLFYRFQENPTAPANAIWVVPLILSLLLFFTWIRPASWLANGSLGLLVGVGASVALVGVISGTLIPQLLATPGVNAVEQITIALLTIIVLLYFQFTGRKETEAGRQPVTRRAITVSGQALLMITFGALFAGAFTTSLVLLTDRLSYLASGVLEFVGPYLP